MKIKWRDDSVTWNLRGETRFRLEGPLLVNGKEQPLSEFKHIQSYCTELQLLYGYNIR
jgi:hypothetical protein